MDEEASPAPVCKDCISKEYTIKTDKARIDQLAREEAANTEKISELTVANERLEREVTSQTFSEPVPPE